MHPNPTPGSTPTCREQEWGRKPSPRARHLEGLGVLVGLSTHQGWHHLHPVKLHRGQRDSAGSMSPAWLWPRQVHVRAEPGTYPAPWGSPRLGRDPSIFGGIAAEAGPSAGIHQCLPGMRPRSRSRLAPCPAMTLQPCRVVRRSGSGGGSEATRQPAVRGCFYMLGRGAPPCGADAFGMTEWLQAVRERCRPAPLPTW